VGRQRGKRGGELRKGLAEHRYLKEKGNSVRQGKAGKRTTGYVGQRIMQRKKRKKEKFGGYERRKSTKTYPRPSKKKGGAQRKTVVRKDREMTGEKTDEASKN